MGQELKQKQIEEMGSMIRVALEYGDFSHLNIHDKDRFLTGRTYTATAEHLYNAGCRKIPENAVVLTKEELDKYLGCEISTLVVRIVYLEKQLKKSRKETAEKFAEMLTKDRQALDIKYCKKGKVCDKAYIIPQSFIDEICKEMTEGE